MVFLVLHGISVGTPGRRYVRFSFVSVFNCIGYVVISVVL